VGVPATIETGAGPAVLLVHGLNGFKEGWGRLPAALAAEGMRAVAVDLPGVGATPPLSRGRHTPAALAAALAPLVAELAPAGVVAHSFGAQVAVMAALAHPDAVRRLALIAPFAVPRPRRLPPRGLADVVRLPLVGGPLGRLAIARARRSPRRRREAFLSAVAEPRRLAGDPAMAALLDLAADRLARADLGAMVQWARAGLGIDLRPLARRVAQPALVVAGELDRVTRPADVALLAGALPAGTLVRVPGAAHFPHLERPESVVPALVRHLA
jgi:pimeloyl-ACP methyl ester carboxylesterase